MTVVNGETRPGAHVMAWLARLVPRTLAVLSLMLAAFFLGGAFGRLTIPAGSGLAGAGTAAMYALMGAAAAGVIGVLIAVKVDPRRLWRLAAVAFGIAILAFIALMVAPRRRLPAASQGPATEPSIVLVQSTADAADHDGWR